MAALGQQRKSSMGLGMSVPGGKADEKMHDNARAEALGRQVGPNRNDPARRRSIGEHDQCGLAVSRLQSKKQRAGFLDFLFGTTLGGRPERNRSRMIRSANEN